MESLKTWLSYLAVAAMVATALFEIKKLGHSHGGEAGARVWFYNQKSHRLYPAPRDLIPPDGKDDTKVRAVVVGFQGMGNDVSQLRIAYLEKYAPELKALFERAEAAHAARKPFTEKIPGNGSEDYKNNSFVKTPDETSWHPLGSEEARNIVSEWREWRGPSGQMPIISVPAME